MTTETLLQAGVGAAAVFMVVLLIEGALRPGYNSIYHTGSELELGDRGWIQRANFLLMASGMFAFAVGVDRSLGTTIGATLLVVFGFGLAAAGVFVPDAVRGYPPGAPTEPLAKPTRQHQIHGILGGPIAFFSLFGACLAVASQLQGVWRWYTVLTAVAGLGMTVWTATAYQRDAAHTGLIQRGLIAVYWSWIVALGVRLIMNPAQP
jgi:hypothetical protein